MYIYAWISPPTYQQKKIIHLCIILWILVQFYTVSDLILFGGHCDPYIMVQRFCLLSLTISNRKTSYRSLKQTAGLTSFQWTTILVSYSVLDFFLPLHTAFESPKLRLETLYSLLGTCPVIIRLSPSIPLLSPGTTKLLRGYRVFPVRTHVHLLSSP